MARPLRISYEGAVYHVTIRGNERRGMNSIIRPVVAYALCQYAGCTQRAAAQLMGLRSGVAVSLQLKRLHERSKSDRKLRLLLKKLNDRFS